MTAPGSEKLVKAGFVVLDGTTGVILKIIVFQYNPETLVRRLDAGTVPAPPPIAGAPKETVSFTMSLDAADKLETGDPLTQQSGLLPVIAALELLLYSPQASLTVWVSGSRRVLPVRISELVFNEQAFDPTLNPIRAEVSVSLQVLKDADLAANSRGRAIWDAHYATLQQLAQTLGNGPLSALGITGI
jgi:hypothetical protein